jgi:hypothetical protein
LQGTKSEKGRERKRGERERKEKNKNKKQQKGAPCDQTRGLPLVFFLQNTFDVLFATFKF